MKRCTKFREQSWKTVLLWC